MKKAILPLLALVTAVGIARSAPPIQTWETEPKIVWNDTLGQAATETTFTDSVMVYGARAVYLLVKSNGSDSISVPVIQAKLPNGTWTYAGGVTNVPPAGASVATGITAATAINTQTKFAIGWYNEFSTGGTPVPFSNQQFRWRVRATNVRGNNATQKVSSGTITITALVLR